MRSPLFTVGSVEIGVEGRKKEVVGNTLVSTMTKVDGGGSKIGESRERVMVILRLLR